MTMGGQWIISLADVKSAIWVPEDIKGKWHARNHWLPDVDSNHEPCG